MKQKKILTALLENVIEAASAKVVTRLGNKGHNLFIRIDMLPSQLSLKHLIYHQNTVKPIR